MYNSWVLVFKSSISWEERQSYSSNSYLHSWRDKGVFETWISCNRGVLIPLEKKIDYFVITRFDLELVDCFYIPDHWMYFAIFYLDAVIIMAAVTESDWPLSIVTIEEMTWKMYALLSWEYCLEENDTLGKG